MLYKNQVERRAYDDALYAARREELRAYVEHAAATSAVWYKDNLGDHNDTYAAAYRFKHRAELRAYDAAWCKANPERKAHYESARRARKSGNGGSHTLAEWREKAATSAGCAYCGCAGPLTRDHVTPLSRGGSDDISNIVPACRSCNSRKGTKTTLAFRYPIDTLVPLTGVTRWLRNAYMETRTCPQCAKEFSPVRHQRFCGGACRLAFWRAKQPQNAFERVQKASR